MPGTTAESAVPAGRARTLAQVYRHFGEADAAGTSPLYGRVAVALSESGEALRAIGPPAGLAGRFLGSRPLWIPSYPS